MLAAIMSHSLPEVASAKEFARRTRELKTITAMMRLYCRAHHLAVDKALCPDCIVLLDYARRRLERCVFGEAKPACVKCAVHCYSKLMRERVRRVMRWAGPRMLLRHPVLALYHLIDGRRVAPALAVTK
jgi:hypothetical protein